MKFTLKIIIILILAGQLPDQSANAVFGLSKCEKLKKQLNVEQSIGFENWKNFDNFRDTLVNSNSIELSQVQTLLNMYKLIRKSDVNIYKKIDDNNNCFTPKFTAEIRQRIEETQNEIDQTNNIVANLAKLPKTKMNPLQNSKLINLIQNLYPNFYDWISGKKLNS